MPLSLLASRAGKTIGLEPAAAWKLAGQLADVAAEYELGRVLRRVFVATEMSAHSRLARELADYSREGESSSPLLDEVERRVLPGEAIVVRCGKLAYYWNQALSWRFSGAHHVSTLDSNDARGFGGVSPGDSYLLVYESVILFESDRRHGLFKEVREGARALYCVTSEDLVDPENGEGVESALGEEGREPALVGALSDGALALTVEGS